MRWNPQKKTLEFHPMLTTNWGISPDGLTYTFKLRKGVKFHDGHPFMVEAVKVTFEWNSELRLRGAASSKSPCIESRCRGRDILETGGVRT
jgi:ABC-type transport system substrate-binding protein